MRRSPDTTAARTRHLGWQVHAAVGGACSVQGAGGAAPRPGQFQVIWLLSQALYFDSELESL